MQPHWIDQQQAIAAAFGAAADHYHQLAKPQQYAAERLGDLIQRWRSRLVEGSILELGCGTGFLSQRLLKIFSMTAGGIPADQRSVIITDLSAPMLQQCQRTLVVPPHAPPMCFEVQDGEQLDLQRYRPALITANFVIQWFQDPYLSLPNLLQQLPPGGVLAIAFPSDQSFPEWQQTCAALDLPYTANDLPQFKKLLASLWPLARDVSFRAEWQTVNYPSAQQFFRDLKQLGAGYQLKQQPLSVKQMRSLIKYWPANADGAIEASYHTVFLVLQR